MIDIEDIISLSHDAGNLILDIYHSDTFDEQLKSDGSPLTKADIASHELIVNKLQELNHLNFFYCLLTQLLPF